LPAPGKELLQVLDPLTLRHERCLLLSLSKYEDSEPPVAVHLMRQRTDLPPTARIPQVRAQADEPSLGAALPEENE
jgi:hypothetical protein